MFHDTILDTRSQGGFGRTWRQSSLVRPKNWIWVLEYGWTDKNVHVASYDEERDWILSDTHILDGIGLKPRSMESKEHMGNSNNGSWGIFFFRSSMVFLCL